MSVVFNADEVFAIAQQIERNGAKFYRRAAEISADEECGKMFLGLAALEDSHYKTFSEMRKELSEAELAPTVFDPEGDSVKYLSALADRRVFDMTADISQRLTGEEDIDEILNMALGAEKDSIVLYVGMKDVVPEQLGKDKIDAIIREEMRHVAILTKELAALQS